jgi:hypothetical protein
MMVASKQDFVFVLMLSGHRQTEPKQCTAVVLCTTRVVFLTRESLCLIIHHSSHITRGHGDVDRPLTSEPGRERGALNSWFPFHRWSKPPHHFKVTTGRSLSMPLKISDLVVLVAT